MPSTTNYQPGDLVLITFPFAQGIQTKNRPALVILDIGDVDVLVARITTHVHQTPYDVPVSDWHGAGLLALSMVRLHKLATLEKTLIGRRLGRLRAADRHRISATMQQLYEAWR